MQFLLTVKTRDGEHEHVSHAIIGAESEEDARLWSQALIIHDDYGFDHEASTFGYGDGTATSFLSLQKISGEIASNLERLSIACRYTVNQELINQVKEEAGRGNDAVLLLQGIFLDEG